MLADRRGAAKGCFRGAPAGLACPHEHCPSQALDAEQFLAWEERQELKHEFDGFQPEAMTGGTAAHETIKVNLITALRNRLRGKPSPIRQRS